MGRMVKSNVSQRLRRQRRIEPVARAGLHRRGVEQYREIDKKVFMRERGSEVPWIDWPENRLNLSDNI